MRKKEESARKKEEVRQKASHKPGNLWIGTSGWMYKDWGREFYPPEMKRGHLSFLAQTFHTVEVNTSFYHLPEQGTFRKWREETPGDFVFSVKLSRFITHRKRLKGIRAPLLKFLNRAKFLKEKLGVVLVQLPPNLKFDEKLISGFVEDLRTVSGKSVRTRLALEPRHASWMEEQNKSFFLPLLKSEKNIALVFPHSSKIPSFKPEDANITSNFVYLRFHGPSEFASSRYGTEGLRPWAGKITRWQVCGLDVFAYFNNDVHGHAVHDAQTLLGLIKKDKE
ncbi:MAG TPA: DUF72 domain-containing protein [Candidatus Paceibacterota bacterium]|nr:DUF72 domain-containing protein [Candidatus Paceibacterota bacterium]